MADRGVAPGVRPSPPRGLLFGSHLRRLKWREAGAKLVGRPWNERGGQARRGCPLAAGKPWLLLMGLDGALEVDEPIAIRYCKLIAS